MEDNCDGTRWMGLAAAKRQLAQANMSANVLVEYLVGGMLPARCKRLTQEARNRNGSPLKVVTDDEAVPQWVWDSIQRRHCYHRWDWDAGYFQGRAPNGGHSWIVRAYGIKVDRAVIDDLAPAQEVAATPAAVPYFDEGISAGQAEPLKPIKVPKRKLEDWIVARIEAGDTQTAILKCAGEQFPDMLLPSREELRETHRDLYIKHKRQEPRPGPAR